VIAARIELFDQGFLTTKGTNHTKISAIKGSKFRVFRVFRGSISFFGYGFAALMLPDSHVT